MCNVKLTVGIVIGLISSVKKKRNIKCACLVCTACNVVCVLIGCISSMQHTECRFIVQCMQRAMCPVQAVALCSTEPRAVQWSPRGLAGTHGE